MMGHDSLDGGPNDPRVHSNVEVSQNKDVEVIVRATLVSCTTVVLLSHPSRISADFLAARLIRSSSMPAARATFRP